METKERIMVSAFGLFLHKGYSDVSVQKIVEQADITKGGFYYFFQSKARLFKEISKRYLFKYLDDFIHRLADSSKKDIKEFLEFFYYEFYMLKKDILDSADEDHPKHGIYVLLIEGFRLSPGFDKNLQQFYHSLQELLTQHLEKAKEEGQIKEDIESHKVSLEIIASLEGLSMVSTMDSDLQVKHYLDSFFNHTWKRMANQA